VTYRCNFRCPFCGYWRDKLGLEAETTVQQFAEGAKKLAQYGTLMISLAGGEPLLRTDLPQIIRSVAAYHFPFLTTNGWLVTEEYAREIMQAGIWGVSVSIDYATPERHDQRHR
jgi:molybdenum cofactor biosynthesis enzyme MoaA